MHPIYTSDHSPGRKIYIIIIHKPKKRNFSSFRKAIASALNSGLFLN